MTQARKTPKYRNGRSKWKKKGAPLFNNRAASLFVSTNPESLIIV